MSHLESPMPLSDIESVLGWVDNFKLSRGTKKIHRDFSDAVLLAEILHIQYPKLVEMHNYPPRNSHALKLNNWMTLNRKVLKKLKLCLCFETMEQLADSMPGVIERVLVMVRDKINRDEEANRAMKEESMNLSSGGSYYEACGADEHVLVVPVKTRVNGVLEVLQQKVVNYQSYCSLKEELKDAKDASEVLRQKVEHLDNLIKLKDERIDELQNQLERKQSRRKVIEVQQNTLLIPNESISISPRISLECIHPIPSVKALSLKTVASMLNVEEPDKVNSKTKIEIKKESIKKLTSKTSLPRIEIDLVDVDVVDVDVNNSNVNEIYNNTKGFSNTEVVGPIENGGIVENVQDYDEFKDSVQDIMVITVEDVIQCEANELYQES